MTSHSAPSATRPDEALAAMAAAAGLSRIHMLAWRDLDDPEAGGSEVHAGEIARRWAAAGINVTMRASRAEGQPTFSARDGYQVVRKAGRYAVFPRSALSGALRRDGHYDGLVEIWNGMPFLSPLWAHVPRVVFLHHVHAEMWRMVLKPEALARIGETIEYRLAPPFYRRSRIITLSDSSRDEIIELLRLPPANVSVVNPGIDERFRPAAEEPPVAASTAAAEPSRPSTRRAGSDPLECERRERRPLVVAVGRLVPVKRFDLLIEALVNLKHSHPALEAVIVGEGYERPTLEALVRHHHAESWLTLPGRIDDAALVSLYQRAWVVTSSSAREGWGMTLTEAAACGTPAVVTRIAGHMESVAEGTGGLLADTPSDLAPLLDKVLSDPELRRQLRVGALAHAARFTWDAASAETLGLLAEEAERRRASPLAWSAGRFRRSAR